VERGEGIIEPIIQIGEDQDQQGLEGKESEETVG
jgi:hypothetical protein